MEIVQHDAKAIIFGMILVSIMVGRANMAHPLHLSHTRHMPIVTITVRRSKTQKIKAKVLDSVHAALVSAGVNPKDRFHRVLELDEPDFQYDPTFPDVKTERTEDFVLIEILLGIGRSVKVKKQILSDMVERLSAHGFDPENIMVVFQDVPWENWSPAGGRVPHA